jgi:hypothetical protein
MSVAQPGQSLRHSCQTEIPLSSVGKQAHGIAHGNFALAHEQVCDRRHIELIEIPSCTMQKAAGTVAGSQLC